MVAVAVPATPSVPGVGAVVPVNVVRGMVWTSTSRSAVRLLTVQTPPVAVGV